MSEILDWARELLNDAGYDTRDIGDTPGGALAFENDALFGFVMTFSDAPELLSDWTHVSDAVLASNALAIRRAEQKAWSVYLVCLAGGSVEEGVSYVLAEIEENLVGTRKIARAGIQSRTLCRDALLPLLPLRAAPALEFVDFAMEVRQRSGGLSDARVAAIVGPQPDGETV